MAAPAPETSAKLGLLNQLLRETSVVCLYFDGRSEEVRVPKKCKESPCTFFDLGLNMPQPIPDLHLDERGVSATLAFGGSYFLCFVPWDRVFAITDKDSGQGVVWKDSMPRELLIGAGAEPAPERAPRSHLRLVK